ncbi:MAG TPA: PTS system mannose/fructose/sorbose family transporter subunit IID [Anaeromyxobacteraceae bacterium]|nr:PTS system mannose/fructose/sorbose family transporter subunit IID [Anaeromyxobacteraceae bacterium]
MRIPRPTLARVFWRCLFMQAAWNRRGMQNLGFAYAIDPALRRIYPDPARRAEALGRHLGFFNCHPYMAAAIVGGAIHHEERVAAGSEPTGMPLQYKQTLQGPLAAVGDGFFWTALRPLFGALAALGALLFGGLAIVVALAVYNAIHVALRARLFLAGYRRGDAVVEEIARLSLPVTAERLRSAGAAACGAAAAVVLVLGAGGAVAPLLSALAAGAGYLALARGARLFPTAYLATLAGIGAAAVLGRIQGGF